MAPTTAPDPTSSGTQADEPFGTRPSGRPLRRVLVRVGQLALTVAVTWFIVEGLGPGLGEMAAGGAGMVTPRWGWIAAASLVLAAGYVASAWIWGRMVNDLGGPRLAPADAIRIYLVANLGRYVPGKLWQIAGLALLARGKGVPPPVATAAALVGQAVALAGAMLIGLIALAQAPPPLGAYWPLAVAGTLLVVLVVTIPRIFRPLLRFGMRWVPGEAPADVPIGAVEGLRWLALYTLNWGGYALSFWMFVRGLSLPGSPLVLGPAFAASWVLGYLVLFAPAGLGVREGAMVVLISPAVGAGPAAFVAVAWRVWTTVVEVVPASAFWLAGIGRARGRNGAGT